ncbi:uncharacterized protein LOC109856758 [Pseudomyrmex gracilis]|uniref:uncharacterized protein LOC109856758 n=1 Tax=Pseudomyrmex gracilis TaxID=219809 RepID=UPI0009957FCB|nr:uncharacterized protein LOC109856758 [Pseudomyrmex gracilis]
MTQEIYILGGEYNEFLRYFANVSIGLLDEISYRSNDLKSFALTKYSFTVYESYFMNLLQKAHRFLFSASSQPILRAILQKTKDSPWANSEGLYILVDSKSRNCIKARSFLWTAWEYDLLSVIFMCTDSDDGIVLYTYNPYTNYTPSNWKEVARAKGRNGHPFIILRKPYDGGNYIFATTTALIRQLIRTNNTI